MDSRVIVNCIVLSCTSSSRDESYLTGRLVPSEYDAWVTRTFHAYRAWAHTSDFESTTSRLMSFPSEEDVDASQVRTFLEDSLYMLTLQQPVVYLPCDETDMGAKHARLTFIYRQHLISQGPTLETIRINS